MSLQVWLPLLGNLNQQGLSNLTFSTVSTNTTTDNSGKIGRCYKNDSHSAGGLVSSAEISLGTSQSMFCWFKFTDLESSSSLGGALVSQHRHAKYTGMGITIKYVSATTGYLSVNTGNGSGRTYNTYCGTTLLQANTWYHGGYTYNGSTLKIYVNGVCENTVSISGMSVPSDYLMIFCWSFSGSSGSTPHTDYKFIGSLNDVRVYDHCLSQKEVKEIAKGLIVHFPFNGNGRGGDNLLAGSNITLTKNTDSGNVYLNYTIPDISKIKSGTKLTVSCDIELYNVKSMTRVGVEPSFTLASGTQYVGAWTSDITSRKERLSNTHTMPSDATGVGQRGIYIQGPTFNSGGYIKVSNPKLEISETPTHWMPNSTDTLYSTMGYNSTSLIDTSGNKYNGTIGAVTYSTDTARNSVSTVFSSGVHGIVQSLPSPTVYTFSWWGKFTSANNLMMWGYGNGNRLNLFMSGGYFYWNTGDSAQNPFSTVSSTTYADNKWHHFAVSSDGTTTKLYIDGAFKANATTNRAVTGTTLYFNGWDSGSSYNFNGSLSDFRLYSTCLSADDIKELYQISASISDNGSMIAYEFMEG